MKKTNLFFEIALALLLFTVNSLGTQCIAQPGTLDNSFGIGGKVTTAFGTSYNEAHSIALQNDGKIIAAGYTDNGPNIGFALSRYNSDGSLDNSFGAGGKVMTTFGTTYNVAISVAIQNDGKIVAAGYTDNGSNEDFALSRYNSDGSLDNTYGTGGLVTTNFNGNSNEAIYSIALQTDGKIVACGFTDSASITKFAIARYNTDGSLDNTFGMGGLISKYVAGSTGSEIHSVNIQSDGKIVIAGEIFFSDASSAFISRYNSDGSKDATFQAVYVYISGIYSGYYDIAIQNDGKILTTGYREGSQSEFLVMRYLPNGNWDNSFNGNAQVWTQIGTFTSDYAYSIALQNDGKIIAGGVSSASGYSNSNFALVRYNNNGSLDNTFGTNGIVTTAFGNYNSCYSIAIQTDGKIIAAGSTKVDSSQYDFAIARYNGDAIAGIVENNIKNAFIVYPNPNNGSFSIVSPNEDMIYNSNLEIYNTAGEKIFSAALNNSLTQIVLEDIANGIYFVKVDANEKSHTEKIIIRK